MTLQIQLISIIYRHFQSKAEDETIVWAQHVSQQHSKIDFPTNNTLIRQKNSIHKIINQRILQQINKQNDILVIQDKSNFVKKKWD